MITHYDHTPPYIQAEADMVLTDGCTMTGIGGRIYGTSALSGVWHEMTESDADALINDSDATEADYLTALSELGVETS